MEIAQTIKEEDFSIDPFVKQKEENNTIDEFITSLRSEIEQVKDEALEAEQLSRLRDIASRYKGEDKLISSLEYVEIIKNQPEQAKIHTKLQGLDNLICGFRPGQLISISAVAKSGKCLAKGTEVLMYDGSLKKVEDIKVGEQLMGEDSQPKNVLALGQGREEMFKIEQRGAEYTVNKSHILSLKRGAHNLWSRGKPQTNKKGTIVNISVGDFLKQSKHFQQNHRGWKTGVDFPKQKTRIDPYFLGLWLGDGTSSSCYITGMDKEVIDYCQQYANSLELELNIIPPKKSRASTFGITRGRRGGMEEFSIQGEMREMGLLNNKHIPKEYLINDRETRLKVLAGIIDTDGHLTRHTSPHYDIIQKNKRLVDDIYFLASSLGFHVTVDKCKKGIKSTGFVGDYYRIYISGDFTDVPSLLKRKQYVKPRISKRDVMTSEIKITPRGVGDYYGFELDGNGLFVLGNFVVTHNTNFCMELTSNQREYNPVWFPFEEGAQELVEKFMDRGETPPVFFVPAKIHSRTLKFIEKKIIEAIAKFGSQIFYIDNLDWIVDPRGQDHERMIQYACMELKRMAVLWNVTIVLIAHVKKLMNPTDQPSYNDIKGSSAVYQISDTVIMMWRETKKERGELVISNNVNVSVQLNRKTGKTGNVKFKWENGHYEEYDWHTRDKDLDDLAGYNSVNRANSQLI